MRSTKPQQRNGSPSVKDEQKAVMFLMLYDLKELNGIFSTV